MKRLLLAVIGFVSLQSCTKNMDGVHDIHDTIYLSRLQIDTFTRTNTVIDTFVVHDNHIDTVIQIKHDTLIIVKTRTDTLFKSFIDTVYLTRSIHDTTVQVITIIKHDTLQGNTVVVVRHDTVVNNIIVQVHDTVSKNVYLHDTLNNFVKIFIHDTVVKITTVIERDTVFTVSPNWLQYPVPAPAGYQKLYVAFDTVPGLVINSIKFQNVYSWQQPISSQQGFFTQEAIFTTFDTTDISFNYGVRTLMVPGPMVCNIIIDYDRPKNSYLTFELHVFPDSHGAHSQWITHSQSGLGTEPVDVFHHELAEFQYINLPSVFQMNISNH